jgi:RNA polymerase sigma-70 factor (ECF subfamily)
LCGPQPPCCSARAWIWLQLFGDKSSPCPTITGEAKAEALAEGIDLALETLEFATTDAGARPTGGDECFQVYQRELDYLLASLRRLGVPFRDIEDVGHEVFLVMLKRWEDYDRARPIRPWLFGIAFRVASVHRRKTTREVISDNFEGEDASAGPDEMAAASETRQLLLKALGQVPLERRAVLVMHDVDEVPMREIASQLGIPLFTAYSRLRKARKELDTALTRLKGGRP